MPRGNVAFVDAVHFPLLRHPDVRVREEELSGRTVHGEAVRPLPRRVDQGGGGAVHHVARRDLVRAGPQGRRARRIHAAARAHREDGAHGAVDVEIRRAVHGIAGDHEPVRSLALAHLDGIGRLLGHEGRAHAGLPERARHDLVAPHVELLDLVAGEIGATCIAELIPERSVGQLLRDDGGHGADAADDRRHAPRSGEGKAGLLRSEMLLQRRPRRGHCRMLGDAPTVVNRRKDDILGCNMTFWRRGFATALAVVFLSAGCYQNVPRYIVTPDKALTEGAIAGLLIGGAAGAGLGAAAGAASGIVGTGASIGAIAGGGLGATLVGPYLQDKNLNETQRAYYACLETRGYTMTR